MTSPPLVSVVTPCYNQAHFLDDCIRSVLGQTYPHFELIVIDDGSTDNTSEVAARYPQVRTVRQVNQGLPAARNAGLRESSGSFLVFLDADDRLLPRGLETNLDYLATHPECAVVSGHRRLIDSDGSPLPALDQQPVIERDHYLALLRANFIGCPATAMYRRAVFDALGGFDTSLKRHEDYDLYLRVARRFPMGCHDTLIAEYRRHSTNMSENFQIMGEFIEIVLRAQWPYVAGDRRLEEAYKTGLKFYTTHYHREHLVATMRAQRRAGEWKPLLVTMMKLLRHYPQSFVTHTARHLHRVVTTATASSGRRS